MSHYYDSLKMNATEAILGRPTARMLILPTGAAVRREEASVEDEPEPASSSDGVLEAA